MNKELFLLLNFLNTIARMQELEAVATQLGGRDNRYVLGRSRSLNNDFESAQDAILEAMGLKKPERKEEKKVFFVTEEKPTQKIRTEEVMNIFREAAGEDRQLNLGNIVVTVPAAQRFTLVPELKQYLEKTYGVTIISQE